LAPDVLVLQEASDRVTVDRLAEDLDLTVLSAEPGSSVAVLSRAPSGRPVRRPLRAGRTCVTLDLPDQRLRIIGLHLSAGLSRRGETARLVEVSALLRIIESGGGAGRTLLVGDLNAIAPGDQPVLTRLPRWIRILLRFDGGIRTDVLSALVTAGFTDTFRRLHPGSPGPTMPAVAPTVRLDYVLAGEGLVDRVVACDPVPVDPVQAVQASDHLPVLAILDL
jgi:endonuclease/exonuclease/phosphatase family metal-dependent hydrolase